MNIFGELGERPDRGTSAPNGRPTPEAALGVMVGIVAALTPRRDRTTHQAPVAPGTRWDGP
jgi:hypothetical protein